MGRRVGGLAQFKDYPRLNICNIISRLGIEPETRSDKVGCAYKYTWNANDVIMGIRLGPVVIFLVSEAKTRGNPAACIEAPYLPAVMPGGPGSRDKCMRLIVCVIPPIRGRPPELTPKGDYPGAGAVISRRGVSLPCHLICRYEEVPDTVVSDDARLVRGGL